MNVCRLLRLVERRGLVAVALVLCMGYASTAHGQAAIDRVRRTNGVDSGTITNVTALGVTISKSGVESTIASEDIESVYLAGEPSELNAIRVALQGGRAAEALKSLEEIPADPSRREEVLAEIEFFTALAKTQLALVGQADLAEATAAVRGFLARRSKSFHVPEAIERLGDLLAAAGNYDAARTEYGRLAKAPSPYYDLLSALLVGRTWQAEGQHEKALVEFDKVANSTESGPKIDPLKLSATLDRAVSQAGAGRGAESAATIGEIIAKAAPEDDVLLSRAYNALGDSYLASGDKKAALFAFLHVDLLYADAPEAHAKALHELSTLWREAGQPTRAQQAAQKLAEKYPGSRWAKTAP